MSLKAGAKHYYGRDLEAMSFARNYHQWIMDEFRPYLSDDVAEIGAGTGNFSEFIVDAGVKRLVALEPSANMYPLLQRRFEKGARVETANSSLKDYLQGYKSSFDSMLYVNVLEHIENDRQELFYAYEAIKRGGYLLIFVPALSWLYSDLDQKVGHYRRYYRDELAKRVEGAGFLIIKIKYFDIVGIIPWYISFVLLKKSITGGSVSLYDKLVVPMMRIIEKAITPPIGKNLLLIGKKT